MLLQAVNKRTGGALAVKVVPLAPHLGDIPGSDLRREALIRELQGLLTYKHDNILTLKVSSIQDMQFVAPLP